MRLIEKEVHRIRAILRKDTHPEEWAIQKLTIVPRYSLTRLHTKTSVQMN